MKADEASAKAVADADGTGENATKAADADGLLKAAKAAAHAEKLKANATDMVRAVGELKAVKALADTCDEEGKPTVTCKAAAQLVKGAGGNDKGPGCVTEAVLAALKGATTPKTQATSEEAAEVRGSVPRLRTMQLPKAAKTIAELATLETPQCDLTWQTQSLNGASNTTV
jgi:ATP-dependent DNA ligase